MSDTNRPLRIPRNSTELATTARSIEERVRPFLERLIRDQAFRRSLLECESAGGGSQARCDAARAAGFDLTNEEIAALLERWEGQAGHAELGENELAAVAGGYEDVSFAAKSPGPVGKGLVYQKIPWD